MTKNRPILTKLRQDMEYKLRACMPSNFSQIKFNTWEKGFVHGQKDAYTRCLQEIDNYLEELG